MNTQNNTSISKLSYYWLKIDRLSAWILLICMFTYFITGYGMTKSIIDAKFATNLHNNILPLVILISFVIHASYATRLALMRWQMWNIFVKIIWFLIFATSLIGLTYIDQTYQKETKTSQTASIPTTSAKPSTTQSNSPTSTYSSIPTSTKKIFTLEELSKYNGLDENPPYVAVESIVYDMSDVFINGEHFTHGAGTELTEEFLSRHSLEEITKYPVVGEMQQ